VYFSPDTSWPGYSILGLEIYFSENWQDTLPLYVRSDSSGFPGPILQSISITVNDTPNTFPTWCSFDLSNFINLKKLKGNFWITGIGLFGGMAQQDSTPYNHTYIYASSFYACAPCWVGPAGFDILIRAVILREDSLSVQNNHLNETRDKWLNAYPNPFNNTVTIVFPQYTNTGSYLLRILNLKGEEVYSQFLNSNSTIWTGVSQSGTCLSSGIYFALIENRKSIVSTQKIIYLK